MSNSRGEWRVRKMSRLARQDSAAYEGEEGRGGRGGGGGGSRLTVCPAESTREREVSLLRLCQVIAIFISTSTDCGPPLERPRAPRANLIAPAARPSGPRNLFDKLVEIALDNLGIPDVLLDRESKLSFAVGHPQPIQGLHVLERQPWCLQDKQ